MRWTQSGALRFLVLLSVTFLLSVAPIIFVYSAEHANVDQGSTGKVACRHYEVQKEYEQRTVKIATWNMYKGKLPGWQADIAKADPSNTIFLLQEAPFNSLLSQQLSSAQYAPGYISGNVQTGVVTSADISSTLVCNLSHIEPWLRTPKASLITSYPLKGRDENLLVANIHAVNFALGMKGFRDQINTIVKQLRKHNGPIVVGGDLNTWNKKRLRYVGNVLGQLGLKPVIFNKSEVKQFSGNSLDHIYYRGLDLLDSHVNKVESSDHNMLVAEFAI